MITEKQLKQLRDNCWKARERWFDIEDEQKDKDIKKWSTCDMFEKIYMLIEAMLENYSEESYWITQYKISDDEQWMEFLFKKENK